MLKEQEAAGLRTQAAAKYTRSHHTHLRSRIKREEVAAACWGVIPAHLEEWIIRHGGLRDA